MGGGAGISVHGAFRVATENTVFAMPETAIGFFPDVGGSHFLAFLDGQLSTYLGLTGDSLAADETYFAGIATHFIPSARIPVLLERLSSIDHSNAFYNNIIEEFSASFNQAAYDAFQEKMAWINEYFDERSVTKIVEGLQKQLNVATGRKGDWIRATLSKLEAASPTSLIVTLDMIRRQKKDLEGTLSANLQREYQLARFFLNCVPDFEAGVTTRLIKKNRNDRVQWSPAISWKDFKEEKKLETELMQAMSNFESSSQVKPMEIPFVENSFIPERTCFSKHTFSAFKRSYPNMDNGLPSSRVMKNALKKLSNNVADAREALLEQYGDKQGIKYHIEYFLSKY